MDGTGWDREEPHGAYSCQWEESHKESQDGKEKKTFKVKERQPDNAYRSA